MKLQPFLSKQLFFPVHVPSFTSTIRVPCSGMGRPCASHSLPAGVSAGIPAESIDEGKTLASAPESSKIACGWSQSSSSSTTAHSLQVHHQNLQCKNESCKRYHCHMHLQSSQTTLHHNCLQQFLQHGVGLTEGIAAPETVAPGLKRWPTECNFHQLMKMEIPAPLSDVSLLHHQTEMLTLVASNAQQSLE